MLLAGGLAIAAALAIRLHNALHYPADWGFDASFKWRYIYRLSRDWALPDPAAGWSTGDPPLYYALGAALFAGLEALGARDLAVFAVPLLSTAAGLAIAALAFALVRRAEPGDPARAWLPALFGPCAWHVLPRPELLPDVGSRWSLRRSAARLSPD